MLCRRKIRFFRRSPGRSYFLKKGHFQGGPRLADDQKKLRHFRERADARSLRCRASFGILLFSPVGAVLGWLTVGFGLGLGPAGGLWHFLGKSRHAVGILPSCVRREIFFRDFPLWGRDQVAASGTKKVRRCAVGRFAMI